MREEGCALSPDEVFGAQVVAVHDGVALRGELIACDGRGIFLSVNERGDGRWQRMAWPTLTSLRLRREGLGLGGVAWVAAGVLTAPLHGWLGPVSGALWGAVGVPSAAVAFAPSSEVRGCEAVRAYARFPQGLPRAMWARFGAEASADAPWSVTPSQESLATGDPNAGP